MTQESSSFLQGAARFVGAEDVIGDLTDVLGDILILDEGEHKYDVRPGWEDIGVTKTGVQIHPHERWLKFQICEKHPEEIIKFFGDKPTIAFLQKPNELVRGYIFSGCRLAMLDYSGFTWRGEATALPVQIFWETGKIMMQVKVDNGG